MFTPYSGEVSGEILSEFALLSIARNEPHFQEFIQNLKGGVYVTGLLDDRCIYLNHHSPFAQ
ncbi:hypothetical protein J2TS4_01740 [Paenibacillus sp. J2TS4]|nr:hypothetical protein J2TS4_01740 [Paenibacillus sp. J2TS4]